MSLSKQRLFLIVVSTMSPLLVTAQAPTPAAGAFNDPTVQNLIDTNDAPSPSTGSARMTIKAGNNNIQISNFGSGSFQLENTGEKRIAAAFIDVTDSIFRDVVFDDDGSGGDSVAKDLNYDNGGNQVGAISINSYNEFWLPARSNSFNPSKSFNPNGLSDVNNLFVDDTADNGLGSPKSGGGFRGELLLFSNFDSSETVGFSGDMDANSIAGFNKGTVDSGANWDVGGVSGSEMIHGEVTILFGDGSVATGTLAADGSNSGSVAVIDINLFGAPGLTVNGVNAGGSGTYSASDPTVIVSAKAGDRVRVSKVEGFDPVTNNKGLANNQITVNDLVTARLLAQYPEFPCNNAKSWEHKEVTIPSSGTADVSNLFSYTNDNNPIAFTAVIIGGNGDPLSFTADPIYFVFSKSPPTGPPPTASPVAAPPVVAPTESPVAAPTDAPVPGPTNAPVVAPTNSPVASPILLPTDAPVMAPIAPPAPSTCSVNDFQGECAKTNQCKDTYPTAFDCKNSEGGVCFCGNDEVCGCLGGTPPVGPPPTTSPVAAPVAVPTPPTGPAPTTAPVASPVVAPTLATCGTADFQGECKLTNQCKSLYPRAFDCKNSEGGVCFCGNDEVCGCL